MSIPVQSLLSKVILVIAGLILLVFHHWGYIGHYGFDDLEYAELAYRTLQGTVDYSNHFAYRAAVLWPTALAYWLFGVSDLSSAMPPLLASFTILTIIYVIVGKQNPSVLALALGFTLASEWFIFYTDKLMPDIYVALAVCLSLFILLRWRQSVLGGIALIIALFIGFTAKATVILILPWLIYVFLLDLFRRQSGRFWLATIISGVVLGMAYLIWSYYVSGSMFGRFTAIEENGYLNACSYDQQSVKAIFERVGWEFWAMGLGQGLFLALPMIVVGTIFRKKYLGQPETLFLLGSSVILTFSANFMSISPTAYNPMCLDVRHYLYIVPILAITGAKLFIGQMNDRLVMAASSIVFLVFALVAAMIEKELLAKVYGALSIITALRIFFRKFDRHGMVVAGAMLISLAFIPYPIIPYASHVAYPKQRDFISEKLRDLPEGSTLVADPVQARLAAYWLGYDTAHVRIASFNDSLWWKRESTECILIRNRHTANLSGIKEGNEPWFLASLSEEAILDEEPALGITLYEGTQLSNQLRRGIPILQTSLDFDGDKQGWQLAGRLAREVEQGREFTFERVGEFSSTFRIRVDSLAVKQGLLMLKASGRVRSQAPEPIFMVLSAEEGGEVRLRKDTRVDDDILAPDIWWKAQFNASIPVEILTPETVLTLYIYNPSRADIDLRDFQIELWAYPAIGL